jgi:DNA-binding response OmpR family regulator
MDQTAPHQTILIVEDNKETSSLLSAYLEKEGFKTVSAYDGRQALQLARTNDLAFVILDLMLPHLDGWEVCRELRRSSDVPILILSARGEAHERILGLTLGADDYVVKPFSPGELVARIKTILRRARPDSSRRRKRLSCRELVLDLDKRKVTLCGETISLTPSEYKLLQTLMTEAGRILFREELLNCLYPYGDTVVDRVVDVHIGKLRQKIEKDPANPQYILTARGLGYQFSEAVEKAEEEV